MKHINIKPKNGDIRADGKMYDGTTWRKRGINHHLNEDGLVFYKRKFRTIEGYLQQGGNLTKLVFGKIKKPQAISKIARMLYNKEESGDIYIISNPSWQGWIKVGMAIDAKDRCKQYQTSSPFRDYKLHYSRFFNDRKDAEKKAHKLLKKNSEQKKGEWFKINKQDAKNIIETI